MRRIAHLSDLHFGTVPEGLAQVLLDRLQALAPDLIVVSGDLTQRARSHQFAQAAEFLSHLHAPTLVVPGNHDVPLHAPLSRLLWPFARWRRHLGHDLEPEHHDDEIAVIGVNTVNPLVWQAGRISPRAVRRVCDAFRGSPDTRTRIVVLHHPLTQAPGVSKAPMRGAEAAVRDLAECGADIVLSGHLHAWHAAPYAARKGGRATLLVQAGTALSSRLRTPENDFNLLTVAAGAVTVERHVLTMQGLSVAGRVSFRRAGDGWSQVDSEGAP